MKIILLLLILIILNVYFVDTENIYWKEPVSGFWQDANNWKGGKLPSFVDNVVIDNIGNFTITIVKDDQSINVHSLYLNSTGGSVVLVTELPLIVKEEVVIGRNSILFVGDSLIGNDNQCGIWFTMVSKLRDQAFIEKEVHWAVPEYVIKLMIKYLKTEYPNDYYYGCDIIKNLTYMYLYYLTRGIGQRKLEQLVGFPHSNMKQVFGLLRCRLREWAKTIVTPGTYFERKKAAENRELHHIFRNITLLCDSKDFKLVKRDKLGKQSKYWSYKENHQAMRVQFFVSKDLQIRHIEGPFYPKTYDTHCILRVENRLRKIFCHDDKIMADLAYSTVNKGWTNRRRSPLFCTGYRKPKKKNLSVNKLLYNRMLSQERARVETALSLIQNRFAWLRKPWYCTRHGLLDIVWIAAAIHNFCNIEGEVYICADYSLERSIQFSNVELFDFGKLHIIYRPQDKIITKWNSNYCKMSSSLKEKYNVEFYFKRKISKNNADTILNNADEIFGEPFAFHEISIIIPSTKHVDVSISKEEHMKYVEMVAYKLSLIAGGATVLPGNNGYWISDGGNLIKEIITIVQVNVKEITLEIKRELKQIAQYIAKELDQEAVFVKINNKAYLVRV
ncbi:hypothetical protein ABK040_006704 [Willaertia magna]